MDRILEERIEWLEQKVKSMNIDFFPMAYEFVPEEMLLEIMSCGLPTRFKAWQFGQSYEYQRVNGKMGGSKVYELVLNSGSFKEDGTGTPCYSFFLDSNTLTQNTFIVAHVIGHSAFFKNNYLFKKTNRDMVYIAAERAQRIDEYIEMYGMDRVEHVIDIALSLEKHIDWHKGEYREAYKKTKSFKKDRIRRDFDDMKEGLEDKIEIEASFPPSPEYDILWFFSQFADLEPWQKDIFEIVRSESFYFYPQMKTKIMNEGYASWVHAELMYLMPEDLLPATEYIDFVNVHEKVVQPGRDFQNLNPYFLGFSILSDIRKRYDKMFENGESDIDGIEKIHQVISDEDDISFLRNYLTIDIAKDLKMFSYQMKEMRNGDSEMTVTSKDLDDIIEGLISKIYNYRVPLISITKASPTGLELTHMSKEIGTLDVKHIEKVMGYIHEVWGGIINLETIDDEGDSLHYTYDEVGFSAPI